MYDIKREHIKFLINNYKVGVSDAKSPGWASGVYDLEYIIESGLRYIYGDIHLKENRIVPCKNKFSECLIANKPHLCHRKGIEKKLGKEESSKEEKATVPLIKSVEILPLNIKTSKKSKIYSQFINSNMALLVTEDIQGDDNTNIHKEVIYGYYKDQIQFTHRLPTGNSATDRPLGLSNKYVTSMDVSNETIYIGNSDGTLELFDPFSNKTIKHRRHGKEITNVRWIRNGGLVDNCILTTSLDGSIYLDRQIPLDSKQAVEIDSIGGQTGNEGDEIAMDIDKAIVELDLLDQKNKKVDSGVDTVDINSTSGIMDAVFISKNNFLFSYLPGPMAMGAVGIYKEGRIKKFISRRKLVKKIQYINKIGIILYKETKSTGEENGSADTYFLGLLDCENELFIYFKRVNCRDFSVISDRNILCWGNEGEIFIFDLIKKEQASLLKTGANHGGAFYHRGDVYQQKDLICLFSNNVINIINYITGDNYIIEMDIESIITKGKFVISEGDPNEYLYIEVLKEEMIECKLVKFTL